jgi:hypothetical protein
VHALVDLLDLNILILIYTGRIMISVLPMFCRVKRRRLIGPTPICSDIGLTPREFGPPFGFSLGFLSLGFVLLFLYGRSKPNGSAYQYFIEQPPPSKQA